MGTNVSTNFITAVMVFLVMIKPSDPKETLGIKLPFLVMIIKNVIDLVVYDEVKKVFYFRGLGS